jgi:hypothetical protein
MKRRIRSDKLSGLQELILIMLLEPRYWALKRRAFREEIKAFYWGTDHVLAKGPNVAVTLSRVMARLEERGLITRVATLGG